jgi:hypothetical protein
MRDHPVTIMGPNYWSDASTAPYNAGVESYAHHDNRLPTTWTVLGACGTPYLDREGVEEYEIA